MCVFIFCDCFENTFGPSIVKCHNLIFTHGFKQIWFYDFIYMSSNVGVGVGSDWIIEGKILNLGSRFNSPSSRCVQACQFVLGKMNMHTSTNIDSKSKSKCFLFWAWVRFWWVLGQCYFQVDVHEDVGFVVRTQ
jgi:hypothetical protein